MPWPPKQNYLKGINKKELGKTMLSDYNLTEINTPLLAWFQANRRILPWREDPQPYKVWVSEIMLQQTRVEAVKPYFERFVTELPTIRDLAECEEERLLKLWEGLGYYNRVRNMQIAARTLMEEYGGELPADYDQLLKLKGIGHYTAGAIASIAYGIPVPAVDGNVLRVITRVTEDHTDIMKQSFKTLMEESLRETMPRDAASAFNQALMELGATVCGPNGAPDCECCPLKELCIAGKKGTAMEYPVKSKAKKRRLEDRTVFVIQDGSKVILNKRPKRGLLAGMYEFPNVEGHLSEEEALEYVKNLGLAPVRILRLEEAKHIFSHIEWHMDGYVVKVAQLEEDDSGLLFLEAEDCLANYPVPSAFERYKKYIRKLF